MAIDKNDFMMKLENEISLLTKLQEEVGHAISRAKANMIKLTAGASIEDVFPPKK